MHIPVLLEEAVSRWSATEEKSKIRPGIYVDATFGGGGHSRLLLEKSRENPDVVVIGIDRDPAQYQESKIKYQRWIEEKRLFLYNDSFANIKEIVSSFQKKQKRKAEVRGVLFDFGIAIDHLGARRGFSFQAEDDPLDMRFNPEDTEVTAAEILNHEREEKLAEIFRNYGEEKYSRRVAKAIAEQRTRRPLTQVKDLLEILKKTLAPVYRKQKIHFATRVFQALRIAVNQEYSEIKAGLEAALAVLDSKGRLAAISFHSGEDRLVKNFFRRESRDCLCPPNVPACICGHQKSLQILTRKPLVPTPEEIQANPSARSAKLRAAVKIL